MLPENIFLIILLLYQIYEYISRLHYHFIEKKMIYIYFFPNITFLFILGFSFIIFESDSQIRAANRC